MTALSQDLIVFFHATAPKGINFLPAASAVTAEFHRTNLDFLARVGQWSARKLATGDSILKTIPFDQTHAVTILQTYRATAAALTKPDVANRDIDSTLLQQFPATIAAMRAVTAHHAQKITAAEFMRHDAEYTQNRTMETVEEAINRLDTPRLRVFFPNAVPDARNNPEKTLDDGLAYTLSQTLDDSLALFTAVLGGAPETTTTHYKAYDICNFLGDPDAYIQCQKTISKCDLKIFFNRVISKHITTYADNLETILAPRPHPLGPSMT